jgi:hypothetical protein
VTPKQAVLFAAISRDLEVMRDLIALGLALGEEGRSLVSSLRAVVGAMAGVLEYDNAEMPELVGGSYLRMRASGKA